MRSWLVGLALVTACYSPTVPQGAPCQVSDECPGDQRCVVGACVLRPGGGAPDAGGDAPVGTGDRDSDGKLDAVDNCPDLPNTEQDNEDGDRFGDVCDPCPPVPGDAPSDPDGDGVTDLCDPNPTAPGDRIELFEGFHRGLPAAWTRTANWSVAAGAVRITAAANADGHLIPALPRPLPDPSRVGVLASVVVEAVVGSNTGTDHGIGVSTLYDVAADRAIECALYQPSSATNQRYLSLGDDFKPEEIGFTSLPWTNGTEYAISTIRRGTSYTCGAAYEGGSASTTGASAASTTRPDLGLRAFSITARVHWMLVVSSP